MGNRPKPTALKLLNGNPGKRAISKDEPQPSAGDWAPPEGLSPRALRMWNRLAPELARMGLFTICDPESLEHGCKMHAAAMDAEEDGKMDLFAKLSTSYRMWAKEFGFTPTARVGLHARPASNENPFDEF